MRFNYPRIMFAIKALAFMAILACILFLMGMAEIDVFWLLGFSVIFIITIFVAYVTPMFTVHEIDQGIILRQGIIFTLIIPFNSIDCVESFPSGTGPLGPVSKGGRIVIASTGRNLVMIKLDHKRRFGMLMLRKADEIIIDLTNPDEFIRTANGLLEEKNQ